MLGSRFDEAMNLALELHREQRRKGTQIPYASHLLAVASLALEHGAGEDEAIAALLHDSVEDQGGLKTLERIRQMFGNDVATIVAGCTDSSASSKPPWRERKEAYLEHLQKAPPNMLLVAAADKLHNARCILLDYRQHGEALWDRFGPGREGVLWYYTSLASTLKSVDAPAGLVAELSRTVAELQRLTVTAD